ncbi:MAG: Snf7 family protein [Candidatus Nitrosocaldus sp.]
MAFISKWIRQGSDNGDSASKIKSVLKGNAHGNNTALRPRIDDARRLMQVQIVRLDAIHKKLVEKDRTLFSKVTQAIQERNMQYASVLSNELAQVRRVSRMVNHVKLALEQINLRLSTISDLGDVVVTLSPAMAVVKGIGNDLNRIIPEFDGKMQEMYDMFNSIMVDTQASNSTIPINTVFNNSDAQAILDEATSLVEDSIKAKLPDLPQDVLTLPEIKAEEMDTSSMLISNSRQTRRVSSSSSSNVSARDLVAV